MRRNSHFTLAIAGFAAALLLAVAGGLLLWGSTYVHNTVTNQLTAQQIYFPPQAAFAKMIEKAGLSRVKVRNLMGGIAAMHSAWRI